jgi:DNA helicase-2/ATP-dependent DNA helicase PcrA
MDYNYLNLLNEQQRAAVVYDEGPSLVIAGAGSGKTRVLTYKIVDLIAKGYDPSRIMALTFTNKAAREMKERVATAASPGVAYKLWMGTFHSVFLRILRTYADLIGYKSTFTIYDTSDSKSLIKTIIKEMNLDDKAYKPATIAAIISNAKNALVSPEQYMADIDNYKLDSNAKRPLTGNIYSAYCARCRRADAMDFDDILFNMNILIRDHEDVRIKLQNHFQYILVDEYQDTNFAQHLIISQLAANNGKLCVVGDDAQSIYSFRGASIANILTLQKKFKNLKVFKLERNYRSTQTIINAAGSLIAHNKRQIAKRVYSENEKGAPIDVVATTSDIEESYTVANMISRSMLSNHDSCEDYAILYRTNAQSRSLEEALRKRDMPYRIYGGLSFYQRKEVRDAIAYFRMAVNPDDDEALLRIINYPARGIGDTTVRKLQAAAMQNNVSLRCILENLEHYNISINSGTARKLTTFIDMIHEFVNDIASGANCYDTARLIYNRSGIIAALGTSSTPENVSKQENLSELLSAVKTFVDERIESGNDELSLASFLSEVSLATDQDNDDDDSKKITLMTIHASKGLEFKHVYITGLEEELFPSAMALNSQDEIEEERRLMYVAMTRAKKNCTISYAGTRYRNGQVMMMNPSRFLKEIDPVYLSNSRTSSYISTSQSQNRYASVSAPSFTNPLKNYRASTTQSFYRPLNVNQNSPQANLSANNDEYTTHSADEVAVGTRISHSRFGDGVVTAIVDSGADKVLSVSFTNAGEKKLLLKFAKFIILS